MQDPSLTSAYFCGPSNTFHQTRYTVIDQQSDVVIEFGSLLVSAYLQVEFDE
jgi:hypothetical protein